MTLQDRIEDLEWRVEELTTPPPEWSKYIDRMGLSPSEARIIARLLREEGKIVRKEALMTAIWHDRHPDDWPENALGNLGVLLHRVRRKLREHGIPLRVENVFGVGYRVASDD